MMAIVDDHMKAYERELVVDKDVMLGMFKAARPVLTNEVTCYDGHAARADLKQVATAIDALKQAAMPRITRERAIDEAVRLRLSKKTMRAIRAEFARIIAAA